MGVGRERERKKKRAVTTSGARLAARINGGREGRNCKLVPLASEIIRAARHRGNRRERWKNSISREREREREIEFRVDNGRVRLLLRNLDRSRLIAWRE